MCVITLSLSLDFPLSCDLAESSLPFAPFVLGATIGRQMTATTTMRGATRGMKIAEGEKRGDRRQTEQERMRRRKEGAREKEKEREEESDGEKGINERE